MNSLLSSFPPKQIRYWNADGSFESFTNTKDFTFDIAMYSYDKTHTIYKKSVSVNNGYTNTIDLIKPFDIDTVRSKNVRLVVFDMTTYLYNETSLYPVVFVKCGSDPPIKILFKGYNSLDERRGEIVLPLVGQSIHIYFNQENQ